MTRTLDPNNLPPLTAKERAELEAVAAMPDVMLISQTNPPIAEAWSAHRIYADKYAAYADVIGAKQL